MVRRSLTRAVVGAALVGLAGLNVYQFLNRPEAEPERATIDRFHRIFYSSPTTWAANRWLGIPAQQNPNDVWVHQEIIAEVKPDVIVETGTLHGGGAALWASLLHLVNPAGRVITIDIANQVSAARDLPVVRDHVDFLIGSSTDPAVLADVERRVRGKKVLVILDSDHGKAHVLDELRAFAPLVPVGSYLIVQDTNVNGHPVFETFGPGPMEAVEEFLATTDEFQPDASRERLLLTMHPKGYLKRVKSP